MGTWAKKTILPDLLQFDANILNSRSFWCAAEDVLSEAEVKVAREAKETRSKEKLAPLKKASPALFNDLFTGIDDSVFTR